MDTKELSDRVNNVERKVDRIYHYGWAAFFVASAMLSGYLWFFNRQIGVLDTMQTSMAQIQLDIALVKREQERQARESDRAWRLLNHIVKKGGVNEAAID